MKNKGNSRCLYYLVPLLMFVIAETVTGNLSSITPLCVILNLVIYYLLYLGVLAVFRTTKAGWAVLNLFFFILATVEYFVISFRERPAMVWDVLAIKTAMTVSTNYKYTITPTLVLAGIATAALCVVTWKWPLRIGQIGEARKKFFGRIAVWGGSCLVFGMLLLGVLAPKYKLDVPMWDPVVSFEKEGFMLSHVLTFQYLVPEVPEGYSVAEAEQLKEKYGAQSEVTSAGAETGVASAGAETGATGSGSGDVDRAVVTGAKESEQVIPMNVICIMNESFSDLRLFNDLTGDRSFETDEPFLEYYDSLSDDANTQKGNLYVPVFGAMTANSEYEVLTGNSCAFVPQGSIPYQFYTKPGDESLATIFSDEGYKTIAMHPYPGYNWNRTQAYENIGFDMFLDQEFYDELGEEMELTKPRDYMSDRSDYDGILHLIREKEPDEKLFIFNVTMQNHGGFEVEGLESTVHVTKLNGAECEGEYPKADQYLTLMQMSDEALEYFLGELEQVEEPTMVVMFGDHQPSVETPFFEALYGMRWTEVPSELKLNSFQTPYMIWTNYDRDCEDAGDMSAFMLGNEILKAAGVEPTGLFAATGELREKYDAVHAMGVLEKDGIFSDSMDLGTLDVFEDIRQFHVMQYYEIFE